MKIEQILAQMALDKRQNASRATNSVCPAWGGRVHEEKAVAGLCGPKCRIGRKLGIKQKEA